MTPTERDRIRRILLDSLPDDPKWAVWAEGVLDRIEQDAPVQPVDPRTAELESVVLSREEAALIVKLVRLGFSGDGSDDLPASALASRLEAWS